MVAHLDAAHTYPNSGDHPMQCPLCSFTGTTHPLAVHLLTHYRSVGDWRRDAVPTRPRGLPMSPACAGYVRHGHELLQRASASRSVTEVKPSFSRRLGHVREVVMLVVCGRPGVASTTQLGAMPPCLVVPVRCHDIHKEVRLPLHTQ